MCCCSNKSENVEGKLKDPVCGMNVDTATANKSQYEDVTYSFCCGGCKRTFDTSPRQYATPSNPVPVRS